MEWIIDKSKGKMMSKEYSFYKCEYCGNFIPTVSPPPKQSYNAAQIRASCSMLIPNACINKKPGEAVAHATTFKGIYCSLVCFLRAIYKVVPWDKVYGEEENIKPALWCDECNQPHVTNSTCVKY